MQRFFLLTSVVLTLTASGAGAAEPFNPPQSENVYTVRDAESAIADAFAKAGETGDIKVSVTAAREEDIITQAAGFITADVDGLEVDRAGNRWQATLLMKAGGRNLAPLKLSGHYDEMTSIPVLKRRMQQGEAIAEGDIDWDKEPLSRLRKNTVTDAHDLIGKSPKHMISQGRPIRLDEIASPAIVAKGTRVTLFFKSGAIEIKTYGEALDSGAKGEVVRVRNITSKAVVQGTVESGGLIRVSAPGSDTAEAM